MVVKRETERERREKKASWATVMNGNIILPSDTLFSIVYTLSLTHTHIHTYMLARVHI